MNTRAEFHTRLRLARKYSRFLLSLQAFNDNKNDCFAVFFTHDLPFDFRLLMVTTELTLIHFQVRESRLLSHSSVPRRLEKTPANGEQNSISSV